jgi:hypothetical protein
MTKWSGAAVECIKYAFHGSRFSFFVYFPDRPYSSAILLKAGRARFIMSSDTQ